MNNAAEPSVLLRDDEVSLIVNGTVRNGFIRTRPGWEHMVLSFTDMQSQLQFEQGVYQGMGFFMFGGIRYYAVAVDGWLYFVDTNKFTVVRSNSQCFSKYSPHVWFQQCNRWLIVQDGQSPAVVIDGYTLSQETTGTGVPTGTFMACGWHRLVVVSPDRRRIFIGDHENNPNSTPITFSEGNQYYANARYFEGPPSLGQIMGVTFTPYQDTSTGIGPLVVFFERGIRAYNIATPRTQWTQTDISQTLLPRTGSSSFFSYTDRGNDVMFRDHDGRIRSLRNAQQVYLNSGYNMPNDFPVWNILQNEDTTLREFNCAATFDNRSLFSIFPRRRMRPDGRWCVIHDGLAVMENTHMASQKGDNGSSSLRDNVWVIWSGLPICGMTTGPIRGEDSLVAFSCGADGVNRMHRLTRTKQSDMVSTSKGLISRAIEMQVSTGFRDFGNVVALKKLSTAGMRVSGINGDLNIQAKWQSGDVIEDWFTHNESHNNCMAIDKYGMFSPNPTTQPSLILSAPSDKTNRFFKASMHFKFTGCCTLEELAADADKIDISTKATVHCVKEKAAPPKPLCSFELFDYDITSN